jgi:hypothetical protein
MTDPDDDPVEEILARSRDRAERFGAWPEQLRVGDPTFAEASALYPWDMSEWQAAVYRLTGCEQVWGTVGAAVLAERSIAPVLREIKNPGRAWSSSEKPGMTWAAHFWDVDPARFPAVFESFYFRRWITACHLRQQMPPALTVSGGERR